MSADASYFWEPWSVKFRPGLSRSNVMALGKMSMDLSDISLESITFTEHGIVYSQAVKHNDRIFMGNEEAKNYFTHYAMIYNGRLWRGKSWGGALTPKGASTRARKFARAVVAEAVDEANEEPAPPKHGQELEVAMLRTTLAKLVDLCKAWIESSFPRMGIVWSSREDYPIALREAMWLLENRGGVRKES